MNSTGFTVFNRKKTSNSNDIELQSVTSSDSNLRPNDRELNSLLQHVNLTFEGEEVQYLNILDWLLLNINQQNALPFLSNFDELSNIDSSINRVLNIINGRGFNGTIELEKHDVGSDIPMKSKVEVSLL